jgi:16S rRNA (guanine527-N7)-methyltransferase
MKEALRHDLQLGLQALDLSLDEEQVNMLLDYLELIEKWNRVYNLTAVRDPAEMLTHHLLDSLAVVGPLLRETDGRPIRLLDVGSGAGLPGVVIAIACPQVEVTCVDTVWTRWRRRRRFCARCRLLWGWSTCAGCTRGWSR